MGGKMTKSAKVN